MRYSMGRRGRYTFLPCGLVAKTHSDNRLKIIHVQTHTPPVFVALLLPHLRVRLKRVVWGVAGKIVSNLWDGLPRGRYRLLSFLFLRNSSPEIQRCLMNGERLRNYWEILIGSYRGLLCEAQLRAGINRTNKVIHLISHVALTASWWVTGQVFLNLKRAGLPRWRLISANLTLSWQ